jgi:hypothetical protein
MARRALDIRARPFVTLNLTKGSVSKSSYANSIQKGLSRPEAVIGEGLLTAEAVRRQRQQVAVVGRRRRPYDCSLRRPSARVDPKREFAGGEKPPLTERLRPSELQHRPIRMPIFGFVSRPAGRGEVGGKPTADLQG